MHVTTIIAAGGAGRRMGTAVPKQMLEIGGQTMLERSVTAFSSHPRITDIIVALPSEIAAAPPVWLAQSPHVRIVAGGSRRQDSVAAAFDVVPAQSEVVLVHDAARPFVSHEVIDRCIEAAASNGGAIAAIQATDTVKRVIAGGTAIAETIPRESVYLAQTPQAFRREVLAAAVKLGRSGIDATDEASLAERAGHPVHVVAGDPRNVKITTAADLTSVEAAFPPSPEGYGGPAVALAQAGRRPATRAGIGYDLHRLVEGRPLVIGGVTIESDKGALGHSDADVACHAATDAILGAASLGDIGVHFPDSDPRWKGVSSVELLRTAAAMVRNATHSISHVDVVVVLERPKIAPFKEAIQRGLADAMGIAVENVSVKGKTNEGVDAIGRGEAIAAHAVALLSPDY